MGGDTAGGEHDPLEVLVLDEHEIGERQLVGNQHAVLRERTLRLLDPGQVPQDADPHVLQVDGAVAEVAVGHAGELREVLVHHALERRLGTEPMVDGRLDLADEALVLEHQPVRLDDGGVEFGEPGGEPLLQPPELGRRLRERAPEPPALLGGILGPGLIDQGEADRRLQQVGLAPSEAGRRREPVQPGPGPPPRRPGRSRTRLLVRLQPLDRGDHPPPVLAALLLLGLQVLQEPRLHDDAAHLGGDRAQEPDLVRREATPAQGLHHQHPDRGAALDDRDAEEGVVALLAGLGEELVAGMRRGIDGHHRLELLDRHAGEPFLDAHRDLADRAPFEAGRRPQCEPLRARIEDVERADVGARALRHHLYDALERLLEIFRARRERADVLQDGEAMAAASRLRSSTPRAAGRLAGLRIHPRRGRS